MNIVGSVFSQYVREQIKVRQQALAETNLTIGGSAGGKDTLSAFSNSPPWIRLISSVNILDKDAFIEQLIPSAEEEIYAKLDEAGQTVDGGIPSGVPITDEFIEEKAEEKYETFKDLTLEKKLEAIGIPSSLIAGDKLAKKLVLQGGTLYNSNTSPNTLALNSGINSSTSDPLQGAYGWGELEKDDGVTRTSRGFIPMPGITSANVQYYNNGALAKATIEIKCYSKKQFALIDVLFLRPGFSVLLEYGHSRYIDNNTLSLEEATSLLSPAAENMLRGDKDQYFIYKNIEKQRKETSGNYDGVIGTVNNFNWKFEKDGTYSCTVEMIGYGSIIESLKIATGNSRPDIMPFSEFVEQYDDVSYSGYNGKLNDAEYNTLQNYIQDTKRDNSDLSDFFAKLKNQGVRLFRPESYGDEAAQLQEMLDEIDETIVRPVEDPYGDIPQFQVRSDRRDLRAIPIEYVSKVHGSISHPDMTLFSVSSIMTDSDQVLPIETYVKFGAVLMFIQENCLAYNSEKGFTPFFKFNMVQPELVGDNRGSFPSLNPLSSVSDEALIDLATGVDIDDIDFSDPEDLDSFFENLDWADITGAGQNRGRGGRAYTEMTLNTANKWIVELDLDKNLITHIPGQFSSDPTVCLIPYTNTNVPGVNVQQTYLNGLLDGAEINYQAGTYVARLMNLPVNVGHMQRVMDAVASEEENEAAILDFLQRLISDITIALGGINQITISVDEDGFVTFRENVPHRLNEGDEGYFGLRNDPYAVLNSFGVTPFGGSFVKDFNFTSNLSSDFGAMIAIGAQANGNQVNENSTAFSSYNLGLEDRIVQKRLSSLNNQSKPNETPLEMLKRLSNEMKPTQNLVYGTIDINPAVTNPYGSPTNMGKLEDQSDYTNFKWYEANLGTLRSSARSFINTLFGYLVNNGQLSSPMFLPFNFSCTTHGISGIKLFEKFRLSDSILPPSYEQNKTGLIVKALNQSITPSGWETNISTYSFPNPDTLLPISPTKALASVPFSTFEALTPMAQDEVDDLLSSDDSSPTTSGNESDGNTGGNTGVRGEIWYSETEKLTWRGEYFDRINLNPVARNNSTNNPEMDKWLKEPVNLRTWIPFDADFIENNGLSYPRVSSPPSKNRRGRAHHGLDVPAGGGTKPQLIYCIPTYYDNQEYKLGAKSGFGNSCVYFHFDLPFEGRMYPALMYYGHTDKGVASLKGKQPAFGQYVGNQGDKGISSGPHLHIELRMSNTATDGHVLEGFESAGSNRNSICLDITTWLSMEAGPSNCLFWHEGDKKFSVNTSNLLTEIQQL